MAQLASLFKSNAVVTLLQFLTLYKDFAYTKTELIKEAGISRKTLYDVWPVLEEYNLVEEVRKVGRAQLYKFNIDNPIAQAVARLADEIMFFYHGIETPCRKEERLELVQEVETHQFTRVKLQLIRPKASKREENMPPIHAR